MATFVSSMPNAARLTTTGRSNALRG